MFAGLHTCRGSPWYSVLTQKYVILTIISGTLSIVLGSLFITIYFIVRNTTSSLHYFETLPTYIPGIAVSSGGYLYFLFRGYWVVTSWLPGWLRFLTRAVIELESQLLGAILTTKMLMQSYVLILNSHIEIPTWCCKHYPAVSPNHQIWNNFNFCFIWKNFKNHNKEGRIKGSSFAENCSGDTLLERFFKRK